MWTDFGVVNTLEKPLKSPLAEFRGAGKRLRRVEQQRLAALRPPWRIHQDGVMW